MNVHTYPKAKTIKSRTRTRTHYRDTLDFTLTDTAQTTLTATQQIKHRAEIAWPLQNMPHGSREFGVRDCNGYYLAFSQHQAR